MKKFIILLILSYTAFACEDFNLSDQGLSIKELPKYVAFDAPGTTIEAPVEDVAEDEGTVSFEVEAPTFIPSDVTVTYQLGGDAVFGQDFNIAGATASEGTVVIEKKAEDFQELNSANIEIEVLNDSVVDGDKTLTITLVNAQFENGEPIAVGRGGTDILRTATLNIADID